MRSCICLIDGYNMYHAIKENCPEHIKWLNLRALTETLLSPNDDLKKIFYFTSYCTWDEDKYKRHREYIKALGAVGVTSLISRFKKVRVSCDSTGNRCSFRREKESDVGMGVTAISEVISNQANHIILITADCDQIPTIKKIKEYAPKTYITVAAPPERGKYARDLLKRADNPKILKRGRLEQCLFKRNVTNATGNVIARGPAVYEPPKGWIND